jgi:serine phosphatase RsbU (regulator of sigma subunit)
VEGRDIAGKNSVCVIIRRNATAGAAEILNTLIEKLNRFTSRRDSEDDVTMVDIKIK